MLRFQIVSLVLQRPKFGVGRAHFRRVKGDVLLHQRSEMVPCQLHIAADAVQPCRRQQKQFFR